MTIRTDDALPVVKLLPARADGGAAFAAAVLKPKIQPDGGVAPAVVRFLSALGKSAASAAALMGPPNADLGSRVAAYRHSQSPR